MKNIKIRGHPPWNARGTPFVKYRDGPFVKIRGKPKEDGSRKSEDGSWKSEDGRMLIHACHPELVSGSVNSSLENYKFLCVSETIAKSNAFYRVKNLKWEWYGL